MHGQAIVSQVFEPETHATAIHQGDVAMTTASRPTVLILGANGRLGLAAAQAFDAAGWEVLAQVRRDAVVGMPTRARLIHKPVDDLQAMAAQAAGAQVVVHGLNPPYTRWASEALPLAQVAMDLAEQLGARFMLPGNVYNFGTHMPPLLRSDTPQQADTRKGCIRVAIEAEIQRRCTAGTLRATVVRAGDFFGAGKGSWFDLVIAKGIRSGKLVYPGPLDVVHPWAYLPDLAQAFVGAAQAEWLASFTNLHFAGHTLTGHAFLDALKKAAATLDMAPPAGFKHGSMPWGLMRVGGLVIPIWRELADLAYLWRVPHALEGSSMAPLALPEATPIEAALRASLHALGRDHAAAVPRAAAAS
jgi:nucleoside-diphosphate-sugar epimerase